MTSRNKIKTKQHKYKYTNQIKAKQMIMSDSEQVDVDS
jgi:hypothetical protein